MIVEINENNIHNKIEIKDSEVKMLESNCTDSYCVKQGYIKNNNETIVCLPNKILIEISSKKNNDIDLYIFRDIGVSKMKESF